jgi:phenylacetate-coenzyme A ligase PaaK-like adenylate-forming protein
MDAWIAARIGLSAGRRLTPERLADYQLDRLNQTLAHAAQCSPFYRRLWARNGATVRLTHMDALRRLPFTTAAALRDGPMQLLCVPQGDVARVVTLRTSGTTGNPKRLFFDADDIERTIDFFHHGMATLVTPGQRTLILMPGDLPDSVGDLLRRGLARMDVTGIVHGPVADPARTIQTILDERIDSLVGIPVQVLALVRHPDSAHIAPGTLRSVLLSTDYVPAAIAAAIRNAWGCPVHQHYGMTEMGYGGGLDCATHQGYHLRKADLMFEIINPSTGQPVRDGRVGEVVITTLTRRAMPLIRYRTGDLAAWIAAPCPCGSALRRMSWVQGRRAEAVRLADGIKLEMRSLDETLFLLPDVIDFQTILRRCGKTDYLHVIVCATRIDRSLPAAAAKALRQVPAVRAAEANGVLKLAPVVVESRVRAPGTTAKRRIVDEREVCRTHVSTSHCSIRKDASL